MKANMSDERIKKVISEPASVPTQPSIMSAPRDKGKTQKFIIVIAVLIASIILNVILLITIISKNELINTLKSTNEKQKDFITELEVKLNERSSL